MIREYKGSFVLITNSKVTVIAENTAFTKRRTWNDPIIWQLESAYAGIIFQKVKPGEVLRGFWSDQNPGKLEMIGEGHSVIYVALLMEDMLVVSDSPKELVTHLCDNKMQVVQIGEFEPLQGKWTDATMDTIMAAVEKLREDAEKKKATEQAKKQKDDKIKKEARKMAEEMVNEGKVL